MSLPVSVDLKGCKAEEDNPDRWSSCCLHVILEDVGDREVRESD